ncbi:MAG: pentapeptide MXKDX repeat protein [Alphaproteobacteria bacterium]|nr:pentapeptide MXKDX repeat protein [Alphaproteobacteria bacterium]
MKRVVMIAAVSAGLAFAPAAFAQSTKMDKPMADKKDSMGKPMMDKKDNMAKPAMKDKKDGMAKDGMKK